MSWRTPTIRQGDLDCDVVQGRRINVLCPTRARERRVVRMMNSMAATASHPERVHLYLAYDEDDTATPRQTPQPWLNSGLSIWESRVAGLAPATHSVAAAINPLDTDAMLYVGDDCVFETPGWDDVIATSLAHEEEHGPLIFYPNDRIQRGQMTIWWWASGRTARAADWIMSPSWNVHNDTFLWVVTHLFDPPKLMFYEDLMLIHAWEGEHERQLDTRPQDVGRINGVPGIERATLLFDALHREGDRFNNVFVMPHARDAYKGEPALGMRVARTADGKVHPLVFHEGQEPPLPEGM